MTAIPAPGVVNRLCSPAQPHPLFLDLVQFRTGLRFGLNVPRNFSETGWHCAFTVPIGAREANSFEDIPRSSIRAFWCPEMRADVAHGLVAVRTDRRSVKTNAATETGMPRGFPTVARLAVFTWLAQVLGRSMDLVLFRGNPVKYRGTSASGLRNRDTVSRIAGRAPYLLRPSRRNGIANIDRQPRATPTSQ